MLDKTYQPADVESRLYDLWERSGAFACGRKPDAPPYVVMMPPPNVTGSLHIGHALTFTLQDVLIRLHRARGCDVLWQPGADHAGIATQMVVERQLDAKGISRHDLGREKFLEEVWRWKEESGGTINRQLRRLGASADWKRERFTMDEGLSHAVRKVFVELHRRGLIYRDKRLVNWDPKLHTAISDLEVEQKEVDGKLYRLRYPIEGEPGRFIIVATTRPETMLGDSAVAVHPDDERYQDLIGKYAILPLVNRRIPIVADDYCDPEKGTGAVKITPAHDFNDFEVGKRHSLAKINIFDRDARIVSDLAEIPDAYRGLDRFEARKAVLADLEAAELYDGDSPNKHMVPHGDRSGVVIEPWLTDQWYCDAATLAKDALAAVEDGRTKFVPEQWDKTYYEWMRNIQPWCVSRQLWWGHQIPAWYGPDGTPFVAMDETDAAAQATAHYGQAVELVRDEDVLDTWFSSALWPFSTLGWPEDAAELKRYYPTSVLVTGFDIIFFWVARMMMAGLAFMDDVPFRTIYIHALVRDAKGQKMSKSKGNVIDPLALLDKYGCDAVRFTLAALAAPGRDVKLAEPRVEGYRNFITKLWNAARFTEMNGCAYDPAFDPAQAKATVNRWIIGAVTELRGELDTAFDAYRFNDAANLLYQFVWGSFCDWWLEFAKPIFAGEDAALGAETRATAAWTLGQILRLLHPIAPFVTEELWARLGYGAEGSLILEEWGDARTALIDPAATAEMEWVIGAVTQIRALRSEMNVPPAAQLALAAGDCDAQSALWLARHEELIRRLARLSAIATQPGAAGGKGWTPLVQGGATLLLDLAGAVDVAAESARLTKEIGKQEQEIGKIKRKLDNPAFIEKADPEVVAEQREKLLEHDGARARLAAALVRLKELG